MRAVNILALMVVDNVIFPGLFTVNLFINFLDRVERIYKYLMGDGELINQIIAWKFSCGY